MKYLSLFICLLFGTVVFSQELKPIAQNIENLHKEGTIFHNYNLFEENTSVEKIKEYRQMATDATVLNLNLPALSRLMKEQPETFEFAIPYKSSKIVVQLYKENIFTQDFQAIDQENRVLSYTPGIYYRGVIADDPAASVVAFSFFDNEIIGVASSLTKGNIVVGKTKDSSDYLAYSDHTLVGKNPFVCGFEMTDKQIEQINFQPENNTGSKPMISRCIRLYYEVAYQPYLDHGSNVTSTLNWLTGIHNNISTLYANDNITVSLNSTMVWTAPDPYVYNYSTNLSVFRNYRSYFYGDLGHLVNSPSTTSVAYLNSICSAKNYAYSAIDQFYAAVPTYSWTIMAMTHEMGHSLGSPHTHACAWNGNNTAIDGCGEQAGHGEGCVGTIPSNGGTIMSYCHLLPTGINFTKGFGPQPGQLIRSTINGKNCLGVDCSCYATITSAKLENITGSSLDVNVIDNTSSSWNFRVYKYNNPPTSWNNTTSSSFNISGLTPNTYYVFEMGNVCSSGDIASSIKRLFLTNGNYCAGDKFYDTGGPNGNYGNGEEIIKTFYPQVPNDKITMTFTEFNLENGYDYMTLYDGENLNAPVFPNGENLTGANIPGPFQATSASGAITVRFVSDPGVREAGWEAEITCLLGTDEFSTNTDIALYPNPANSIINIESTETIQSVQIYDMTGRSITRISNVNNQKTTISLNGFSSGLYFVKVSAGNKSQVLRFVKK
ncbi:MAG TPA: T9SS type A sorting domain-containing protein [Flavobacteriaceae bacterium]|nr:T9SS type A sorting domain-containing protein [Flavobacteriaceae bacterium]